MNKQVNGSDISAAAAAAARRINWSRVNLTLKRKLFGFIPYKCKAHQMIVYVTGEPMTSYLTSGGTILDAEGSRVVLEDLRQETRDAIIEKLQRLPFRY